MAGGAPVHFPRSAALLAFQSIDGLHSFSPKQDSILPVVSLHKRDHHHEETLIAIGYNRRGPVDLVAVAADLNGKWKAEFTTPDGTARFNTFNFKAEGPTLTGTVAGAQDETPIQNGKISGDEI